MNRKQLFRVACGVSLAPEVPETEFSFPFVQGRANAMSNSFFKYGAAPDAYPARVDAIQSLEDRLNLYKFGGVIKGTFIEPGNPAYLVDVANFAMIEFRYPRHANRAYWNDREKDTAANSPGRTRLDNAQATATNDGLSQEDRAAQKPEEQKLESSKVYKRQGD